MLISERVFGVLLVPQDGLLFYGPSLDDSVLLA